MQVRSELVGDMCLVKMEGRFVTGYDKDFLPRKAAELTAGHPAKMIVDMSDVLYIDSTGIGFLIALFSAVSGNGSGRFGLAGPNGRVREVLDLTKLSSIIPVYPSLEAAQAGLA